MSSGRWHRGIRRRQVSSPIGRQVPIQQTGGGRRVRIQQQQQKKRLLSTSRQQSSSIGRQVPIQQTGGMQVGRQVPIQQQQQKGQKLPQPQQVPSTSSRQQKQQQPSISRQQQVWTSGRKLTKAAEPVTGQKLPQLYRICISCKDCNPRDIQCNVNICDGQCNLIVTGPYRRCYTLPQGCDYNKIVRSFLIFF